MLYITPDASLFPLNTFGIHGSAKYLVKAETPDDLQKLLNEPAYNDVVNSSLKPIGQGSNLVFTKDRYDGAFLQYEAKDITIKTDDSREVVLTVGAGVVLDELVDFCCKYGLWGLENLSLIPGTIGAAAVQNVGAYGVEFKDCVTAVNCYDLEQNETRRFNADEIAYSYRDSIFKHSPAKGRYIILSVEIKLSKMPKPKLSYGNLSGIVKSDNIVDIRKAVIDLRRSKLPEVGVTGSAGSFFKNPVLSVEQFDQAVMTAKRNSIDITGMPVYDIAGRKKISAAWLIDKAGWKGFTDHHAGVWGKQPLVLVNTDGMATGNDIVRLAGRIAADIKSKFGITLETEVEYL